MLELRANTRCRQFSFACILTVLMLYLLSSQSTELHKDALNRKWGTRHSKVPNISRDNEDITEQRASKVPVAEEGLVYISAKLFDGLREARRAGALTRLDRYSGRVRVKVSDTNVLTPEEYLKLKADGFITKHANPWPISHIKPTLIPYTRPPAQLGQNQFLIHKIDMKLQSEENKENLMHEDMRRYQLGDDDIMKIPGVQAELTKKTTLVPNIVHYIWFNCRKFKFHHFLSFKSVLDIQKPRLILVHADCPPNGSYFKKFSQLAGPKLKIVRRSQPTDVWGIKVQGIEHRADVTRLQILLQVGGIYLDSDIIVLKSLDPLMNYPLVLGSEIPDALANGVILVSKDSWFLKRWYQEYKFFDDNQWSDHSCYVPWELSKLFPDLIHIEWDTFIRPNAQELELLYHEVWDWTNNYVIHLYSRYLIKMDGQEERPLREFAVLNTTYGEIVRLVLWGDPKPRDVTEWL